MAKMFSNLSLPKAFLFIVASLLSFASASAADLVLSPASGTFQSGDTFTASIYVTNNAQAINARFVTANERQPRRATAIPPASIRIVNTAAQNS